MSPVLVIIIDYELKNVTLPNDTKNRVLPLLEYLVSVVCCHHYLLEYKPLMDKVVRVAQAVAAKYYAAHNCDTLAEKAALCAYQMLSFAPQNMNKSIEMEVPNTVFVVEYRQFILHTLISKVKLQSNENGLLELPDAEKVLKSENPCILVVRDTKDKVVKTVLLPVTRNYLASVKPSKTGLNTEVLKEMVLELETKARAEAESMVASESQKNDVPSTKHGPNPLRDLRIFAFGGALVIGVIGVVGGWWYLTTRE